VRSAAVPAPVPFRPLRSKRLLALASDKALVEHIRRGNEAAFAVVFERHVAGLLGFCRHMLGSPEEAEDAVQHTFAAAFRDLGRPGDRDVALKPWLYAIARNRCLSILRSRREQAGLDFDLPTEGLAEEVERRADLRDLLRDLRELPEEQRAALLLAEAGDLSHAEVAGVLGCEVANVKELVYRARTGLIQRREARETPCADIRAQLANLRGNSLRRSGLRHHLRSCPGCRAYFEQLNRQRRMLRAALPMVPSLDLKSGVLTAAGLGSGSAGSGLAAGLGTGLSASLGVGALVKVAAVGVLAGGGLASGTAILTAADEPLAVSREAADSGPASANADFRAPVGVERRVKSGVQRGVPAGDLGMPEPRSRAAPLRPDWPDGDQTPRHDEDADRPGLGEEPSPSGLVQGDDAPPNERAREDELPASGRARGDEAPASGWVRGADSPAAPLYERPAAPVYERHAAPVNEGHAAPVYERRAAPVHEGRAAPVHEGRAAPVHEGHAAPVHEGRATPAYQGPATVGAEEAPGHAPTAAPRIGAPVTGGPPDGAPVRQPRPTPGDQPAKGPED
jgi:RNA polymerase sigma factor (sigma-70 family)